MSSEWQPAMELTLVALVLAVFLTRTFPSDAFIKAKLGDDVNLVGMCAMQKQKPWQHLAISVLGELFLPISMACRHQTRLRSNSNQKSVS